MPLCIWKEPSTCLYGQESMRTCSGKEPEGGPRDFLHVTSPAAAPSLSEDRQAAIVIEFYILADGSRQLTFKW